MVGGTADETKVTTVTDGECRKFSGDVGQARGEGLVEVAQRARAGAARIATGAATTGGNGRGCRAFGRSSEHTELRA